MSPTKRELEQELTYQRERVAAMASDLGAAREREGRVFALLDEWEAAYPLDVFPEPPPPPAETSRDRVAASMARHVVRRLREQLQEG